MLVCDWCEVLEVSKKSLWNLEHANAERTGPVQDTVTPTSELKVCSARLSRNCSAAPDRRWRLSFAGGGLWVSGLQGCQDGQVEGSGLGDCHGVAPLLPQSLICPACTGLRAKAGDYLHCTSTPTTHCLLATQHHAAPYLLLLHLRLPRFTAPHLHDSEHDTRTHTSTKKIF